MSTPLIVATTIGIAIIVWAIRAGLAARRLHPATRIIAALTFVSVALFCVWGIAAAMEPGDGHIAWRVLYAAVFVACLSAIGFLLLTKRTDETINQE